MAASPAPVMCFGIPDAEFNFQGRHVFLKVGPALGSGDGHHVLALRQNPGQRQLRRIALLSLGYGLQAAHVCQVLFEIPTLEARAVPPPVVGRKIVDFLDFPREEAAAQRAVGHKANAQLPAGGEDSFPRPGTIGSILSVRR